MFQTRQRKIFQGFVFLALVAATVAFAHSEASTSNQKNSPIPVIQNASPQIEVVFVLDTTGSMSGLIEGAKRKIWSIANQMASGQPKPKIKIGLIGYRDRGDQYVTQLTPLTSDIDQIYSTLQDFRADGGGDTPESVNQALHEAITKINWSDQSDVYRVVFLVGDAPPHMDYPDDVPWNTTLQLAQKKDIRVNTIQCGSMASTQAVWANIASAGSGQYVAIKQDGAMIAMETPMDKKLNELNQDLASTVIAYGKEDEKKELHEKLKQALESSSEVVASRLSYLGKAGGYVTSGRRDLVDAVKDGIVEAEELPASALPPEMKSMNAEERKLHVQKKAAKREKIQEEINHLVSERDEYIRKENKRLAESGKGDGFDQQVLETVRKQAAEKGIDYN